MSNQDRAAKARDKAFRKAARQMAERYEYTTSLDPDGLKEYLLDLVSRNLDEWTLIWDRALRYADRWWDGAHLVDVTETAKIRLAKIKALEQLVENRDRNIKVQAGIIEQQRTNLRGQAETVTRLRDQCRGQESQDRELRLANLRIANLSRRLNTAEAQLAEARALTTQGTTTVFEENERLVAEVRRLTSLLADEEEKVTYLKDLNNRLHVDLAVTRVQARRKVD